MAAALALALEKSVRCDAGERLSCLIDSIEQWRQLEVTTGRCTAATPTATVVARTMLAHNAQPAHPTGRQTGRQTRSL